MPTLRQLSIYGRGKKRRRSTVAALKGAPQRKGIIKKMSITTPRKPNSAKRRYARVMVVVAKKLISAKPPGRGVPYIQQYSEVLIEGGSPPDTPGVNYSLIRGVYDFIKLESFPRANRRSKFGVRKLQASQNLFKEEFGNKTDIKKSLKVLKLLVPIWQERKEDMSTTPDKILLDIYKKRMQRFIRRSPLYYNYKKGKNLGVNKRRLYTWITGAKKVREDLRNYKAKLNRKRRSKVLARVYLKKRRALVKGKNYINNLLKSVQNHNNYIKYLEGIDKKAMEEKNMTKKYIKFTIKKTKKLAEFKEKIIAKSRLLKRKIRINKFYARQRV